MQEATAYFLAFQVILFKLFIDVNTLKLISNI